MHDLARPHLRNWDFLANQQFLPRVTYQKNILALASWNIPIQRLAFFNHGNETEQIQKLSELFTELGLPNYVYFIEGDNELLLHTHHSFTFRTLKKAFKKNKNIQLKEAINCNKTQMVSDENGHGYANEIFVPLTKTAANLETRKKAVIESKKSIVRNFAVGSEWAYFQIYTGISTADKILMKQLAKLVKKL